jgi:hypothetical protein
MKASDGGVSIMRTTLARLKFVPCKIVVRICCNNSAGADALRTYWMKVTLGLEVNALWI